jgi:hypothetical protein
MGHVRNERRFNRTPFRFNTRKDGSVINSGKVAGSFTEDNESREIAKRALSDSCKLSRVNNRCEVPLASLQDADGWQTRIRGSSLTPTPGYYISILRIEEQFIQNAFVRAELRALRKHQASAFEGRRKKSVGTRRPFSSGLRGNIMSKRGAGRADWGLRLDARRGGSGFFLLANGRTGGDSFGLWRMNAKGIGRKERSTRCLLHEDGPQRFGWAFGGKIYYGYGNDTLCGG